MRFKIAITAATLSLLAGSPAGAHPMRGPACDVAAAVTAARLPHRDKVVVVGIADDTSFKSVVRQHPPSGARVPPALVKAWVDAPNADILDCPAVQALLKTRSIPSGAEAARAATHDAAGKRLSEPKAQVLAVGMPVVSADGREAVVEAGVVCGQLCGDGLLVHLRRTPTGWTWVGALPLWIS